MRSDGMSYAPQGKARPVVAPGEFRVAAVMLEHGHINGMCQGLLEAGAQIAYVYDPDPGKVEAFRQRFPDAQALPDLEAVLDRSDVHLVAAAAIPADRGPLGVRVMEAGKDYFTDKTPFTELDQLQTARAVAARSGRRYFVYYSERLHTESGMRAGELVADGAVGDVVQVVGFGPHRLNAATRPSWFFERDRYGGILCDIGSHQIEQFLHYTGAGDATIDFAYVGNHANSDHPELQDFGEAVLTADNGARNYFRVDWFTPPGLPTWGDGRTFILGTRGYLELRKYLDVGRDDSPDHLYLVNDEGPQHLELAGKVGFPFFGRLIIDCLERTETAMTQEHTFKAAELCLRAQLLAEANATGPFRGSLTNSTGTSTASSNPRPMNDRDR